MVTAAPALRPVRAAAVLGVKTTGRSFSSAWLVFPSSGSDAEPCVHAASSSEDVSATLTGEHTDRCRRIGFVFLEIIFVLERFRCGQRRRPRTGPRIDPSAPSWHFKLRPEPSFIVLT